MRLYTINKDYIEYLKEFDNKVVNVDYANGFKLFVGKIKLQNNNEDIKYYIPLTSYKEKFFDENNQEQIDIFKIKDKSGANYTSVLNINNMIPAPDLVVTEFGYDMLRYNDKFRSYQEKDRYYHLTIDELNYINKFKDDIEHRAKTTFSMVNDNNNKYQNLANRCCDFLTLFEHAIDFNDIIKTETEKLFNEVSKSIQKLELDNKKTNFVTHNNIKNLSK